MFLNLSCPAVSQMDSFTEYPLWSITFTRKSKPTVGRMSVLNFSSVNLSISDDLPTPGSPITKNFKLTRLSRVLRREMFGMGVSRHLALHWGQLFMFLEQWLQTLWPLLQMMSGLRFELLKCSKHTSQQRLDITVSRF